MLTEGYCLALIPRQRRQAQLQQRVVIRDSYYQSHSHGQLSRVDKTGSSCLSFVDENR
jgi:hypothetical protein